MEASTTGRQPHRGRGIILMRGLMHDVTINPDDRRDNSSLIRQDYMMPTSLTLDTARNDDGKLVLIAAGEIDLSNIDAFDQALATATTEAAAVAKRLLSTSALWSTWTAPPSMPYTSAPTTSV